MNNNKHLKPNLIDPLIERKIIKTLKPQENDYWKPAKSGFKSFFEVYIKPNIALVVIIVIIIIFLIYRYRIIQKEREAREVEIAYKKMYGIETSTNDQEKQQPNNKNNIQQKNAAEINEYTDLLLQLYNQQKEKLREPRIKNQAKFAYPMYPYAQGGSLAPSNSR